MADVITGDTQLGASKNDLILSVVQKELQFKAKLASYVSDVSVFARPGNQSISFPKLTSFTVVNRASGVAGDASALTATVDKMDLDFNAYVSWIIDSLDETQTSIDAQLEFAKRAAGAQGRYVDTQLIGEAEAAGFAITTIAALMTRDVVLEMRKKLILSDGDLDKASYWVGPDQEEALLKIDEFTRADAYGSSNIPSGVLGKLFGVPVVVHNGIAASQYFLVEADGLALGFQKAPAMGEQDEIAYGVGAKRKAIDQLFGVQALQLGEKGAGATVSALIIKDNN